MPGNYPEESIQHSEHGKSLKQEHGVFFASYYIPTAVRQEEFSLPECGTIY